MEFPPRGSTGRTNDCGDGRDAPGDVGLGSRRLGNQPKHLVWHQDLICPGGPCRGRVQTFPPGVLVDDGRRERRRCPVCGASVTVPAFYLGGSVRNARFDPVASAERAGLAVLDPHYGDGDSNRHQPLPPIPATPTMSVSHAVTGALVVTVFGTIGPNAAERLRYEIVKFLRAGRSPVVLDLLRARGSERTIVAALGNLHTDSSYRLPDRSSLSTHPAETGAGREDVGDNGTNEVRLRLVLDPTAADAWALLDPSAVAAYLTLADALEP